MGRARGANALLNLKFETVYGTPPSGDYQQLPFVSSNLGEEQQLLESDLLGLGREGLDPTLDVANNDGDLTVPVDNRAFGYWLMLLFGAPTTTAYAGAQMDVEFLGQPAVNSTITINGTAFTAKASGATGNQFDIGAALADTITNLAAVLNASVISSVAEATYTAGAKKLSIVHDTLGQAGLAFTVSAQPAFNVKLPAGTLEGGVTKHVFKSGALNLPSVAIEIGMPDVPSYEMNFGVRGNTLRIQLQRQGHLNATLGLIAQGSNTPEPPASGAGTPVPVLSKRFAQATGEIKKDGVVLASVVGSDISFTNNLDKVETIRPDGRIEDADGGTAMSSGNITVRFRDHTLLNQATSLEPVDITQGWTLPKGFSLLIHTPRVFLPKVKRPISGQAGIQASFNWQASGEGVDLFSVELINDVAAYA